MVAKHVSSPTFSHFSLSAFLLVLISLSTFGIPCDADGSTTQKPFIEDASDRFISRLSRLAQDGQDLGSKFGFRSSKRIRRASISSDTASPSVPSIVGSKRLADDKDEKEQFAIAKYSVPARLAKDFIDKWHETHVKPPSDSVSSSSSEPIHFALAKAALDSSNFWEYGQWSSVSSWFDWSQEDTPQSWFKWVRDNDVEVDFWSLGAVTDPAKERRGKKGEDEKRDAEDKVDAKKKKDGKKKKTAEILSEFHVHPDDVPDFEDAFQQYASKTWEEEGNQVFGLRKVLTTNHHYWSYGAWDSLKDFRSHILSKHAEALRDFAADRDIIWDLNPMITVGCDEDKPKSESRAYDEASKNRARFGMDERDEDEDDDEEEEEGRKWDLKDFLGPRFGGKDSN